MLGIERLATLTTLDATKEVRDAVDKIDWISDSDPEVRDLVCKMAMQLDRAADLLPGKLVDLFFALLDDKEKLAAFMQVDGENKKCGNYWGVVHAWASDSAVEGTSSSDVEQGEEEEV